MAVYHFYRPHRERKYRQVLFNPFNVQCLIILAMTLKKMNELCWELHPDGLVVGGHVGKNFDATLVLHCDCTIDVTPFYFVLPFYLI
jgi:hypothetical protein